MTAFFQGTQSTPDSCASNGHPTARQPAATTPWAKFKKLLRSFGCSKFGSMVDDDAGVLLVQFECRGRMVSAKASTKGYAAAWLKENPWSSRMRSTRAEHERKAMGIASVAVYSILRDWIKGQVMAIETGILSFEGAFLGQILLPSGKTILEHATEIKLVAAPGESHE